ncbi:MAG: preprotein translocase subunit SecE [Candidatus Buchananbacteria bacterium RIFCSPLOWO2_01_FULL_46_12]|uniref:Protein translocase subunit SecE n=2 Tax=Candidatus Buchananiibacteriota TaxID=1817903 RepID=A0A1G1YPA9_9BACT|nr:MAG: preprotein translocase subunit SecE [Candidatus Buchananbacteria bacterium RIFCSPHIGHO2_01_FULL_44_11]OGY53480.1 MAG: preprotein translocase subunit SecE [Candidatus Buchananbacteria bacterium RIFCSPLOWO2_01_FULL_46_12]
MNIANRLINYIKASQLELKKVIWPSKKEVTNHTALVIGISLALAAFLGAVDYLLTLLVETII